MSLFRDHDNHLCGAVCDTVLCPTSAHTGPVLRALIIRTTLAADGWSSSGSPSRLASPDYCPGCTADRTRRGPDLCTYCQGGDLYDYLGHNTVGHRTANALYRSGVIDRYDLADRDLSTLAGYPQLGSITFQHIRLTLLKNPIDATKDST